MGVRKTWIESPAFVHQHIEGLQPCKGEEGGVTALGSAWAANGSVLQPCSAPVSFALQGLLESVDRAEPSACSSGSIYCISEQFLSYSKLLHFLTSLYMYVSRSLTDCLCILLYV